MADKGQWRVDKPKLKIVKAETVGELFDELQKLIAEDPSARSMTWFTDAYDELYIHKDGKAYMNILSDPLEPEA